MGCDDDDSDVAGVAGARGEVGCHEPLLEQSAEERGGGTTLLSEVASENPDLAEQVDEDGGDLTPQLLANDIPKRETSV